MNLLQQFVDFLLNQKTKPSLLTVKNYKADVGQFINWCEKEFRSPFDPSKITMQILQDYKKARGLSESSMERHTSSLRKFFSFLKTQKIIIFDLFPASEHQRKIEADPWMIRNFKNFLYDHKKSNLTIKNYINDVKSFFVWFSEVALLKYSWNTADKRLLDKINSSVIEEFKQRLITAKFSPLTINRKLSSLRNYLSWAKNQGLIPERSEIQNVSNPEYQTVRQVDSSSLPSSPAYSSFPPKRLLQKSIKGAVLIFDTIFILPIAKSLQYAQYLSWKATGEKIFKKNVISKSTQIIPRDEISNIKREFYAPLNVSTRYLPTYKKIWHYIRYVRPNWYKRYHSYSFTHYFHFSILMILSCAIGFGIYNSFFITDQQEGKAILGTTITTPPRFLSFQGRLTDSSETPIIKEADILFSLYNDENASSAASLWQEIDTVIPDSDGVFSALLGKKTVIPDAIFNQNSQLFLGITVGNSPELRPRQELATVPFAGNSQTLQGLEPITNTAKVSNVILALDSSGNLNIAGAQTHTFQAIDGNLVLSGKILSLTTVPGSNSNVQIVPDGIGKIDLSKPIQNSTDNNNLTSAAGSVEFDDTVAILATTSAQAALYINQNSTGTLISASTSGVAKFTVGNDGAGIFAGDLGVNGGDLTTTSTTFNLLNSTAAILNIGGAATSLNLGVTGGDTTIKSNLILPSFTSNGGILYTNASGKILQASASSSSDCLMGGTTPSFTSCSKIFNQASTVGIGTTTPLFKLDVQDSQDATAAAAMRIYNTSVSADAAGLIIRLGNTSPSSIPSTNHFINFETDGAGTIGSIRGNGMGLTLELGNADFAEYVKKNKNQTIEYGSVVCLANNGLAVKCNSENNKIIGVASERPAFLGGKNLNNESVAVGLVGQIQTFISTLNGEIKAGDLLTSSDIPGVAVKATKAGQIIGKALEDLTTIDESRVVGYYDPNNKEYRSTTDFPNISVKSNIIRVVKVNTLINVSWYDPGAYLAQNGDFIIHSTGSDGYSLSNSKNEILTNIEGFLEVVSANIKSGLIQAQETITDSLVITSDSVIVNGQNLKDYIVNVVKDSGIIKSGITSPVISTNELSTNIISPLSSPSLIVKLSTPSGSLKVENASGSAVVVIDNQGNASFSGQLSASSGQFADASVSGILRAKSIVADSIDGLEARISSITANTISNTNFADLASYSAQLSYVPDFTADRAQFNQGLMVFGSTSLYDLSIAGNLSIGGTMFVSENSIEALGTDLSLQSLRQGGLSIMGGLVYVDTEGNIKIQGNLAVAGKLAVNIISPLPASDLVVHNASGSSVLSVNQTGDVVASGSGTFAKLNFSFVAPVLAISATEVIASSSAGITSIAPYQSEVTIKNTLVTDKSVIYITPVGTPSAQTPFLMRQIPEDPALSSPNGSFTVGVESPTNHSLDFNWLIIN